MVFLTLSLLLAPQDQAASNDQAAWGGGGGVTEFGFFGKCYHCIPILPFICFLTIAFSNGKAYMQL